MNRTRPARAAAPRRCGVLLHPTALPGTPGSGSFGAAAHAWLDLLAEQGIGAWQLLPLAPTDGTGSPYSSPSGFALNPWLLDGDELVAEGFLTPADLAALPACRDDQLDLEACPPRAAALGRLLRLRWPGQPSTQLASFGDWRDQQAGWLQDHCRFMVLRDRYGHHPWWSWPEPLARHRRAALRELDRQEADGLLQEALLQWHLQRQWQRLHDHAHALGVELIGDLPFYVAHDSADVWANRALFSVRSDGSLSEQSGVPPDYFSDTGQLWGTPVYCWWRHRLGGFRWWRRRLARQLQLFDLLRLDHFRALEAYWGVPGGETTAQAGQWKRSPGAALLASLQRSGDKPLRLIAEDLGVITPAVEALRDRFALPGMKILQFAFDGNPDNAYLPANYRGDRWVVYTGTHDNATCLGWWKELSEDRRRQVGELIGQHVEAPGWQLLELALGSSAELAMVPLQDLLHLDDRARFNTPGTRAGNWCWRLWPPIEALRGPLQGLGELARRYGRYGREGVDVAGGLAEEGAGTASAATGGILKLPG